MTSVHSEEIMSEAHRCLQCKRPRCQNNCPIGTDVPEMISLLLNEDIKGAGEETF